MSEKEKEKPSILFVGLIALLLVAVSVLGNLLGYAITHSGVEGSDQRVGEMASSSALVNSNFDGSFYCYQDDCMMTVGSGWEP